MTAIPSATVAEFGFNITYTKAKKSVDNYLKANNQSIEHLRLAIKGLIPNPKIIIARGNLERFFQTEYPKYQTLQNEHNVAKDALNRFKDTLTYCTFEDSSFTTGQISHLQKLGIEMGNYKKYEQDLKTISNELREKITDLEDLVKKTDNFFNSYKTALNSPAYHLRLQQGKCTLAENFLPLGSSYFFDQGLKDYINLQLWSSEATVVENEEGKDVESDCEEIIVEDENMQKCLLMMEEQASNPMISTDLRQKKSEESYPEKGSKIDL